MVESHGQVKGTAEIETIDSSKNIGQSQLRIQTTEPGTPPFFFGTAKDGSCQDVEMAHALDFGFEGAQDTFWNRVWSGEEVRGIFQGSPGEGLCCRSKGSTRDPDRLAKVDLG